MPTQISRNRQLFRAAARALVQLAGRALTAAAVIGLLFAAHQYWGTDVRAHQSQRDLQRQVATAFAESRARPTEEKLAADPPRPTPPSLTEIDATSPASGPAGALGLLRIPSIGLDLIVLDGADRVSLQRGPGHLTGTPSPGQPGNSVIAGHRTTWGAPFAHLERLRPGDRIEVTTPAGRSDYIVSAPSPAPIAHPNAGHRIIRSDDLSIANQDPARTRLTLLTCHPRFSSSHRLVVVADRIGPAVKPLPSVDTSAASGSAAVDVLAFTAPSPARWTQSVPPAALALLCWLLTGRLARGPTGRARWRRMLRTAAWRTTGAALVAFPLFVTFDRLAPLLPIGG